MVDPNVIIESDVTCCRSLNVKSGKVWKSLVVGKTEFSHESNILRRSTPHFLARSAEDWLRNLEPYSGLGWLGWVVEAYTAAPILMSAMFTCFKGVADSLIMREGGTGRCVAWKLSWRPSYSIAEDNRWDEVVSRRDCVKTRLKWYSCYLNCTQHG